jgi:hypothetical protein
MTAMAARFLPERAKGRNATIEWAIATPVGEQRHAIHVEGSTCRHVPGRAERPSVTIALSVPTFARLVAGRLNGLATPDTDDSAFDPRGLRGAGAMTACIRTEPVHAKNGESCCERS